MEIDKIKDGLKKILEKIKSHDQGKKRFLSPWIAVSLGVGAFLLIDPLGLFIPKEPSEKNSNIQNPAVPKTGKKKRNKDSVDNNKTTEKQEQSKPQTQTPDRPELPSDPGASDSEKNDVLSEADVSDASSAIEKLDSQIKSETPTESSEGESEVPQQSEGVQTNIQENNTDQAKEKSGPDSDGQNQKKTSITSLIDTMDQMDKLPQKAEYAPPPIYNIVGRGLVYNCIGKHWACVDRRSYQKCLLHGKWARQNGIAAQCKIFEVYQSSEDCAGAQVQKLEAGQDVNCTQ